MICYSRFAERNLRVTGPSILAVTSRTHFSHIKLNEHEKSNAAATLHRYPRCTAYVLLIFALRPCVLIFFDINWTKNGYLSRPERLLQRQQCRQKNVQQPFVSCQCFTKALRHNALIKKYFIEAERKNIEFLFIFSEIFCRRSRLIRKTQVEKSSAQKGTTRIPAPKLFHECLSKTFSHLI